MLVRSPRWLAQRGCCFSPQPQVTRAFQTAGSSHRLHLTVLRAMGQCAGVVVGGPALAPADATGCGYPPPVANASGGGATVEQIEGRLDRLEARRSTSRNVSSNLAVGLITALATLGGVWLGTSLTADAEDARADEDFAREQRIDAYGEFLAAADSAREVIARNMPDRQDFHETPIKHLNAPSAEEYAEVTQAMTSVETLLGRISVIGGQETTDRATRVRNGLNQGSHVLSLVRMCHADPQADSRCSHPTDTATPPYRGADKYGAYTEDHFAGTRIAFLERARSQLGMPD